jgi:hypothetical protein
MTCHSAGQHTVAGVPVVKIAVAKRRRPAEREGRPSRWFIGTRLFRQLKVDIVSVANPWVSAPNDLFNGLIWPKDG